MTTRGVESARHLRLVAFPYHDWRKGQKEGMRWRDGHILELLDRHPAVDAVLVVDRPVSVSERFARRLSPTVIGRPGPKRRVGSSRGHLTYVGNKTCVLDVLVQDIISPVVRRHAWWFDVFEREPVLDILSWASDLILGAHPATIAWMPTVTAPIKRLEPSRFVFDSLDNWLLHPQLKRYSGLAAEGYEQLLARADAVLVSAPRSRAALSAWNSGIEVVPNGVSVPQFNGAFERPAELPAPPVVGYAGSVGPRLDGAFVSDVASALPSVNFVFLGQSLDSRSLRELTRQPNVMFLGDRHYSLLPAYVNHFDVAWIPHAIGEGESGGDPIKMYEYWAAKRQVVATRIDGLERWDRALHLVSTPTEAVSAIAGLISGDLPRKPVEVPEERTWEAITDHIVALLQGTQQ